MKSPLMYLGTTLIILLTAALIGPMFIDWSSYRADLERYGTDLIGRQVSIDGPVRIRLLPAPVLEVRDVRIANPGEATAKDFVSAASLEVRLVLSPLLKGRIEVESIAFEGASFEFERIEHVGGNWQLGIKSGLGGILSADNVSLETATIRNSTIVLRDGARGGVARLDNVDLDVSAPSLIGPYRIRGSFEHEKQQVAVAISTGRRTANGEMRLSVNLTPVGDYMPNYGFDGRLLGFGADATAEGKLHIARDLPVPAEDALPLDPAEVGLPFSFKSSVKAGLSNISLQDIELLVDQAQPGAGITGVMEIGLGDAIDLSVDLVARHLDLDRIAGRAGLNPADFIPRLGLVDTVARLLHSSPESLNGDIRMDVNALTVGGETIEAVEFRAGLADRELNVTRISGVLPGRSSLELTDLSYAVRSGTPGFEGHIKLVSRDTNGFMHWALPGMKTWLNATTRGFKGRSSLNGKIAIAANRLALSDTRLELDDTTANGSVSFGAGERPVINAELALDRIDFDRYLPPRGEVDVVISTEEVPVSDPFGAALADIDPALFSGFDGKIKVSTGPFSRWKRSGDALLASVELLNGELLLHQVAVTNFHQLDLTLDGHVNWAGGRPQGRLGVRLDSPAPANLLDLDRVQRMLPAEMSQARRAFERMAPMAVAVTLETTADGAAVNVLATAKGTIGDSNISADAVFTGDWNRFRYGAVKLNTTLSSTRSDKLFTLLGNVSVMDDAAPAQAGNMQLSMAGSLVEGIDFLLKADVHGTQFDIHGLLSDAGGQLSAESAIVVTSKDAGALYRALGLVSDGQTIDVPALTLKGLVSAGENEIVVTGLGGKVGGVAIGLDGTANFQTARPQFFGNLTVAELDLPWAVSRGLKLSSGVDQGDVWSAEPFGLSLFRAVDLNMAVRAGELKLLGGAVASQMQAEVTIADGTLTVERLKSSFADGELSVDLRVVGQDGQLGVEGRFNLKEAELASTLTAGDKPAPLRGRYTMDGTFKGSGRSPIGLVSSLSGAGKMRFAKAALRGVNPGAFSDALREAKSAAELDGLIRGVLVDGEMVFSGLESEFSLDHGIVRFAEARIESTEAMGRVAGLLDLPAWRMDNEWIISLKKYADAPPLSVILAGSLADPERQYETSTVRSFFVVKVLTAGVQKLEQIQREEEERIRRFEELERKARIELARRTEELMSAPEPDVFAPPEPEIDVDDETAEPSDAEAPVPFPELLVRTPMANTPVPGVPDIQDLNQFAPSTTGTVAPADLAPVKRGTVVAPLRQPPAAIVVPEAPGLDPVRSQPLPAPLETADDGAVRPNASSDPAQADEDVLGPELENVGDPVNIQPNTAPSRVQQNSADDPSSWRK